METYLETGQLYMRKGKAEKWIAGVLVVVLLCSAILEGTPLDFTVSMLRNAGMVTEMTIEDADREKNAGMKAMEWELSDVKEDNAPNLLAKVILEEDSLKLSKMVMPEEENAKMPVTVIPDGEIGKNPELVIPEKNITEIANSTDLKEETQDAELIQPSEPLVEELPDHAMREVPVMETAFVIDEEGMICDFYPEYASISDGVLTLPEDGCTGIRSGAFADCGAEIYEIYIPAAISVIEEGAFSGLDFLEWIEAEEGNPGCCSVDGVLFDATCTVLLAFANGRIGTYLVPGTVTRIGEGAFENTSITALDLRQCGNVTFGNNVFGRAADKVKLLLP